MTNKKQCDTMQNEGGKILTKKHIDAIETILARGDRVELIPIKDDVRVIRILRQSVK